jgi:tetratricopeptide (TPR) repeat protein
MRKMLVLLIILGGSVNATFSRSVLSDLGKESEGGQSILDEEYERYKKRADAFFDQGDYANALRQYYNCLEVPTFENDPYAKGRIVLAEKFIKLRQNAYQALNAKKGPEAVAFLEEIIAENPKDSLTKVNLTDYWTGEATQSYAQQDYELARSQYQEALKYARERALIEIQIQNCETYLTQKSEQLTKTVETEKQGGEGSEQVIGDGASDPLAKVSQPRATLRKRHIGIKLATAAVGLGAGAYAYTLNRNYQMKLDEANRLGKIADPDGDNVIMTTGEFNPWQTAYKASIDARKNRSKFVASLGVVGAAALAEVILLALPRKPKPSGLSVGSSTQNLGLAIRYTFR